MMNKPELCILCFLKWHVYSMVPVFLSYFCTLRKNCKSRINIIMHIKEFYILYFMCSQNLTDVLQMDSTKANSWGY